MRLENRKILVVLVGHSVHGLNPVVNCRCHANVIYNKRMSAPAF